MLRALLISTLAVSFIALTAYLSIQEKPNTPAASPLAPSSLTAYLAHLKAHGKRIQSPSELEYRLQVYGDNMAFAESVNNRQSSFTVGDNLFADLTFEEFKEKYLSREVIQNEVRTGPAPRLRASKDWRTEKKVGPIKNQGRCGSCWAFSTVAALETEIAIKNSQDVNLSEQELVDCSGEYGNQGCNGGLMSQAFSYIKDHQIGLGADYPYTAKDGACKRDETKTRYSVVESRVIDPICVDGLMTAIQSHAVSVAIEVQRDFQLYKGGIYKNDNCGAALNHGVAAVGFVNEDGEDQQYFIVRNSWGESWGENGYVRMFIGTGSGTCGIANDTDVYPVLN